LNGKTHFRLIDTAGNQAKFKINEIFVFSEGELPEWVQRWEPTHEKADMLLLVAHPDDELIFFGGTIPTYAVERGMNVVVAYMTYSNTTRRSELLNGLWSMGVRNYPVIGPYKDAWADTLAEAEAGISRYDAAAYLTEQIRRFKPSVVIGHDLMGEYGHGQHVLCAVSLTDAIVAAADASIFPDSAAKYGAWNTPKMYLHLYGKNEIIMNWDVPLASFGGKTGMEVAREAFALHVSQQGFFYVYGEGDDWDSRRFGLYRSTVGPDVIGGDVFEHIDSFY
jgi:LmbE family N-acetylglucosaminyl deacetylase